MKYHKNGTSNLHKIYINLKMLFTVLIGWNYEREGDILMLVRIPLASVLASASV